MLDHRLYTIPPPPDRRTDDYADGIQLLKKMQQPTTSGRVNSTSVIPLSIEDPGKEMSSNIASCSSNQSGISECLLTVNEIQRHHTAVDNLQFFCL